MVPDVRAVDMEETVAGPSSSLLSSRINGLWLEPPV
jgi:hypothetical protein